MRILQEEDAKDKYNTYKELAARDTALLQKPQRNCCENAGLNDHKGTETFGKGILFLFQLF